jgi:hypothetical protein
VIDDILGLKINMPAMRLVGFLLLLPGWALALTAIAILLVPIPMNGKIASVVNLSPHVSDT